MTWVTCDSGVVVSDRVAVTIYLAAGVFFLLLGGIDWLPWVVNLSGVQGLEHGDTICELFRAHGGVGEELSSFGFMFLLMVGNFPYLSI